MKNTVCISIEEYDNLRNFKTNIEGGKFLVIEDFHFARYEDSHLYSFFTESEIVNKIAKQNKKLQSENKALKAKNRDLSDSVNMHIKARNRFKATLMNMTYRKFRRWRKEIIKEVISEL